MEYRELNVEARQSVGSGAVAGLRRAGKTPGVIYGEGSEALALSLSTHEFAVLGRKAIPTQIFRFKSSDAQLDGKLALVKDVQIEPLKGSLLHIDFLAVSEGHRITVAVPLRLAGEVAAVKEGRAMINQSLYEIELECLPTEIPDQITVQISHLREGQSIHAGDLALPAGAELQSSPDQTVVSIVVEKKEEPAAGAGEAVSPEATPLATDEENES